MRQRLAVVAGGDGEGAEGQVAGAEHLAEAAAGGAGLAEAGGAQRRAGGEEGGGADGEPAAGHRQDHLAGQRVDLFLSKHGPSLTPAAGSRRSAGFTSS